MGDNDQVLCGAYEDYRGLKDVSRAARYDCETLQGHHREARYRRARFVSAPMVAHANEAPSQRGCHIFIGIRRGLEMESLASAEDFHPPTPP